MMRNVCVRVVCLLLCGVFIARFTNSYIPDRAFDALGGSTSATIESSVDPSYDRMDEVKKFCGFVMSSATELKPDNNAVYDIKDELNFLNGDWRQDGSDAPILPYVDRKSYKRGKENNMSDVQTPLNLVSFWVTDVDFHHRSKKWINVNGFLTMAISLDSLGGSPYGGSPHFQMWPGHTQLSISFQGIYVESRKNGGERVMCLLGSTMLPSRESESSDPWEWAKGPDSNFNQPPLLQDDQILLDLHFPMKLSLTNRVIKGEMRSLNSKTNPKYFGQVHILSQLSKSAYYEFGSENLVSKACDPYPYNDPMIGGGFDVYKGTGFCDLLGLITGEGNGAFTVVPNWKCNGTDEFCSKLGPFVIDKEIKETDGSFSGVQLYMQDVKCKQIPLQGNASSAKVAAVFRAVPPMPVENQYVMGVRSGPSNLTVAAEGIWKSSSGQLCMVGCLELVDTEGSSCNSRICLYIPISFSIKQRSIIVGSFFSTDKRNATYFPLAFEKLLRPEELWNYFRNTRPSYSYSKLEKAGTILERNEPFSFGTVVKKSLMQFPKLEDAEEFITSLSLLSEDLTIHTSAYPEPLPSSQPQTARADLSVEILSLGPLFGRYWSNTSLGDGETSYHSKAEYTEKQVLLNVSAQITLYGPAYNNFSVLFLEGLYDPHVGKMYLVGCRDVRASWKILFDSMDLESGLDCSIEVIVSYPSTTSRWLANPTAKVSINSLRNDDDPLRFKMIRLQTHPIMYRKQREDVLSRRGVEGILRILTLSFAIACILSQLFYIKHETESVPFISLVMLGVQALVYSLPLITGAEALFKRMSSESYETSFDLEKNQWVHVIDYTVNLLALVSFLLTLRLCQKLWKSRIRLLTRSPNEPCRVPSDKKVFITTAAIHVIGYVTVLIIHSVKSSQKPFKMEKFIDSSGSSQTLQQWVTELEEYLGLVQDFFLLPQVIGNILWQIDCKPLRKLYFIGITAVRLLPHVYDYIRSPVPNPYFADEYEFANPNTDFYSKFGDVAIPTTAILLAAAVYIQQRWNYEKLSQSLVFGRCRILPLGSRVYQRLPSKSYEAELASGTTNGNTILETDRDNEE